MICHYNYAKYIILYCSFQNGWSPLHYASAHSQPSIVEILIKSGAQLDIQTKVRYCQPLLGEDITLNIVCMYTISSGWLVHKFDFSPGRALI